MAEIVANGVRLHVQRLAPRQRSLRLQQPVVFIHGLGMDNLSSFYYTLANPLAHAGADVVLYDLRGHGFSERPRTGYRVSDSVADLAALLTALDIDGPVHLVGNSYGGTVALSFATAYPEQVASMVLIEAHVPLPGWGEQMATTIRTIGSRRTRDEWEQWMAESRKNAKFAAVGTDLVTYTTFITDIQVTEPIREQDLRELTQPVRAVYGQHSDVIHHAQILDNLLPRYTLTVLPDVDHWLLVKTATVLRTIVLDWFAAESLTTRAATW
jgi:3-oxoadipate enol-lactonase